MANLHRVRMQKMRADALAIHPYAQREKSPRHIKRLMDDFNLDAVGTIHAVQYPINGKPGPWVVDGQHRILALLELGLGEWEVDVATHVDVKTDALASNLFLALNHRLNVGSYDKFINELKSGNSTAVGIDDILRMFGITFSKTSSDGSVACPSSLKKAYQLDDGKALARAIGWLTNAYGKKASALEGKLIEATALVASRNNGNLEDAALVKKLAKYPGGAPAIVGDAKGRLKFHSGSLSRSIATIIVDAYNSGRRIGKLEPI
jgi:hypothetical protein